jgi:hypothetical protein
MKAILIAVAACAVSALSGQTPEEAAAIRKPAMDYIGGWYDADAARMESALHPDLAKRRVFKDEKSGMSGLHQMSAMTLVQMARRRKKTPEEERIAEVMVLDVYGDIATVKLVAKDFVDYLHVALWNGEWKIVNVLWALKLK